MLFCSSLFDNAFKYHLFYVFKLRGINKDFEYWIFIHYFGTGKIENIQKHLNYINLNLILKKIFIGVLTNIAAYVPVFVLIQIFKRTSSVLSKSIRLEKLIENTDPIQNKNKLSAKESKSMSLLFPWWFKIFLYLGSFVSMSSSIILVTFKGNFYRAIGLPLLIFLHVRQICIFVCTH